MAGSTAAHLRGSRQSLKVAGFARAVVVEGHKQLSNVAVGCQCWAGVAPGASHQGSLLGCQHGLAWRNKKI